MTTQPTNFSTPGRRNALVAGIALIVMGVLLEIAQLIPLNNLSLLVLPGLGCLFLVWGIIVRKIGLLIPGSILLGLGAGTVLVEGPLHGLSEPAKGGVILLSFGLSWGLVTLFSAFFTRCTAWWPLVVGGILSLVGAALLAGPAGEQALILLGKLWPLALVIIGAGILLRRK